MIEGIARAGRALSAALPTMDEAARGLAVFGRMLRSEAGAALASEPPRP